MDNEQDFLVCGRDCENCPEFENCQESDQYDDSDEPESTFEEQFENEQFAQDGEFDNLDMAEWEDRISGTEDYYGE